MFAPKERLKWYGFKAAPSHSSGFFHSTAWAAHFPWLPHEHQGQLCKVCENFFARHIAHLVRSEKLQNESSPNFSNFAPTFPQLFKGFFVLRFVGNGDQKEITKNPRRFSMQYSQANIQKNIHNIFWRAGVVTFGRFWPKGAKTGECLTPLVLTLW